MPFDLDCQLLWKTHVCGLCVVVVMMVAASACVHRSAYAPPGVQPHPAPESNQSAPRQGRPLEAATIHTHTHTLHNIVVQESTHSACNLQSRVSLAEMRDTVFIVLRKTLHFECFVVRQT